MCTIICWFVGKVKRPRFYCLRQRWWWTGLRCDDDEAEKMDPQPEFYVEPEHLDFGEYRQTIR